jgi:hypothetical protein
MSDNETMRKLALEQVQKTANAVIQADLEAIARDAADRG